MPRLALLAGALHLPPLVNVSLRRRSARSGLLPPRVAAAPRSTRRLFLCRTLTKLHRERTVNFQPREALH